MGKGKKMEKKNKNYKISHKEIKALLFWTLVGANKSIAGSQAYLLPAIFVKWIKKLKLTKEQLFVFGAKKNYKGLGKSIIEALELEERIEGKKFF